MFGSPTNSYGVTTSFTQPPSAYLPNPSPSLNRQTINQANAQLFGQGDLRNLLTQYAPSSNAGVSNDIASEPGMMSLMNAPRSQAASQAMQNNAGMPFAQNLANFSSLLNMQGQNAGQAFGIGNIAQQLGQALQGYQLGNYGGNLGLVQSLLGNIFGGLGNLTGGMMPSTGSLGGSSLGSLGSLGSDQVGIGGLTTG